MQPLAERLRAAAIRLTTAGWPILPVTYPIPDHLVSTISPADATMAEHWWGDQPYGIACRTGETFDVVEVPSWLGPFVLRSVDHYASVVEVTQSLEASWLFFVTPGSPRIQDLPRAVPVTLHGRGGWVLLPPTPTLGGGCRWVARPPALRLPHSLCLQWSVVRAINAARHAKRTGRHPEIPDCS
ncbi:MAG TPA: bifunctional DNA primase/polymerase [Pseudonocardiaceae bacterium]